MYTSRYSYSVLPSNYNFFQGYESYVPPNDQDELYATQFYRIFREHGLGSSSVNIAVLDTGFNSSALDTIPAYNANHSYNFFNNNNIVTSYSTHGTKIMYLLGAGHNDELGMDGFAPGCPVSMYKISDDDGENVTTNNIIRAINQAIVNNIRIINISFGTTVNDPLLKAACQNARDNGIIIVASVANRGVNEDVYPAAYSRELNNVIAVGALSRNTFNRADFSSFGNYIDVYTEGEEIKTLNQSNYGIGEFVNSNGASFAGAIVTATVAHMLSVRPELTPAQVKNIIRESAGKSDQDENVRYLRAYNAVQFAKFDPVSPSNIVDFYVNSYQAIGEINSNVDFYNIYLRAVDSYTSNSLFQNLLQDDISNGILAEISPYWGILNGQVNNGRYWFEMELQTRTNNQPFKLYDQRIMNYEQRNTVSYLIGELSAVLQNGILYLENLIGRLKFSENDINNGTFTVNIYPIYENGETGSIPVRTFSNAVIDSSGRIIIDTQTNK